MDEEEKTPAGYDVELLGEYDFTAGVRGKYDEASVAGDSEAWLAEANAARAALQDDTIAMVEIQAEQALWDQTLADGLEEEEW